MPDAELPRDAGNASPPPPTQRLTTDARPAGGVSAPHRILAATAHRLSEAGAVRLNMQDVATEAGVSKGLIHYHFHDKDTLLARLVAWMTAGLIAREQHALDGVTPQSALDALWGWLDDELARGHLRGLVELSQYDGPAVRDAVRTAARARREAATATIERLFGALGLKPRLPAPLLAEVTVAFLDGLAIDATLAPEPPRRVVFDVYWLSVLSLVES